MNHFLNQLERRFGSWAIPGLIRYVAIFFLAVYLLSAFFPHLGMILDFDLKKIAQGELWRVFTFVFAPHAVGFTFIGILFAFFAMMLTFSFSDGLEQQWGVFRTNLYLLWGYLSIVIGAVVLGFLFKFQPVLPGSYLALSVLFAFATYHPRFTLMVMLIIPVQIWIIAAFVGGFTVLGVVSGFLSGAFVPSFFTIFALSNYIAVVVSIKYSPERRQLAQLRSKNKSFNKKVVQGDGEAFHKCHTCGATDISHPNYDFRVADDGKDYCSKHLP